MKPAARSLAFLFLPPVLLAGCATWEGFLPAERPARQQPLPPLEERPRLEPISRNYFELESEDQRVVGEPQIVFTTAENTFSDLAREYGLGYDEIVAANPGVDPWLPGEGTPVLLPTQHVLPDAPYRGVVLNIAAKRLFYFPPVGEGEPVKVMTYPMGIGRVGWETPVGEAEVIGKALDPHWYVPWSVQQEHREMGDPLPPVVPPGPDNPLGRHVLQLDLPGYLIHGTNKPYGVGMRVSHGCVRLYPENIETLYSLVGIGESVRIVNEPFLAGSRNGELYFEAHVPLEDDTLAPEERLEAVFAAVSAATGRFAGEKERNHARTIVSEGLGIPVRVLQGDSFELYTRARIVRNTVEPDPDAPTLAEVRELLDAPLEDAGLEARERAEAPAEATTEKAELND